ncbi:MAG: hypothetical protein ACEPOZ_17855 [Marinifilaceae bacterium]|jgi:hypothetical protein
MINQLLQFQKKIPLLKEAFVSLLLVGYFLYPVQAKMSNTVFFSTQNRMETIDQQQREFSNSTPLGLFTYHKWVDLNENSAAERNEFFGLGKKIFASGESLSATLYDPDITQDTPLKIRIWDHTGNLIRTSQKTYIAGRIFTFPNIDKVLPPGEYILTINPENSKNTYSVNFTIQGENTPKDSVELKKEDLPKGLHLFTHWEDANLNNTFDHNEITGLDSNSFPLGSLEIELGLNLPLQDIPIVYQTWNTQDSLLGMSVSNLAILQHYSTKVDSIQNMPDFLQSLVSAPAGSYKITAILADAELTTFEKTIHLTPSMQRDVSYPTINAIALNKPGRIIPVNLYKGLEGFFLFADYIDLNKDSIQQEFEFVKLRQQNYNARYENVHAQFHLPKYKDHNILLSILDQDGHTIIEQKSLYQDKPHIFEISNSQFRLAPGQYLIRAQPENSNEKFEETLTIH